MATEARPVPQRERKGAQASPGSDAARGEEMAYETRFACAREKRAVEIDEDQPLHSTPAGLVRRNGRAAARNSSTTGKARNRHRITEA